MLLIHLDDLQHLRAVKADKHHEFAKDRDMLAFFVSAKTGECIETLFRQAAAHLMHIVLPKTDTDSTPIITASIVRQEPQNAALNKPLPTPTRTRTSICSLQ